MIRLSLVLKFLSLSVFAFHLGGCQKETGSSAQQTDPSSVTSGTMPTITPLRPVSSDGNGFVLQLIGKSTCPPGNKFSRERFQWGEAEKDKAIEKITKGCDEAIAKAKAKYSEGEWKRMPMSKCEGMCPKNLNMQVQMTKKGFNVTGGVTGTSKIDNKKDTSATTNNTSSTNSSATTNNTANSTTNNTAASSTAVTETCSMSTDTTDPKLQCIPSTTTNNTNNTTGTTDNKKESTTNNVSASNDVATTSNTNTTTKTLEIKANLSFSVDLSASSTSVESIQCVSADSTERFYSSLLDLLKVCE